ncbi:MAG: polysaccharide deacetylase family protein, partial [Patescibacteria group bacterium]|nr:polysaccharide deacetylase family protein [Patescibacteria group bacterium]
MTDASIIIVYHYIQRKEERPRMKGMLVDDFERHVKLLLESGYRIVTLHEYLEATKDLTTLPPSKMAVLSFDDGLKVHIENVMPLFQKYGLKGSFFVITRPLTDRWLAPVHKNHLLLAASVEEDSLFSVADLITEATRWLVKNSGVAAPLNTEDLIKKYAAMSPWDDQTTAYYKYLLNVFVSEPVRSLLIDHLFRAFYGELSAWVSKFYLDKEDIQQMQRAGMEIGSH